MQQWEYRHIYVNQGKTRDEKIGDEKVSQFLQIESVLNALGAQGWEVVGQTAFGSGAQFTLKRRKE